MNPSPELHYALKLQRSGNLAGAGAAYREILLRDPKQAEAWNLLGTALFETGQTSEAADSIRRAIELRPRQSHYHTNLARILHTLGDIKGAEECCRQALRLDPDNPQAINNLGGLLLVQDRHEEAEALLQRAARLKPDYAEPYLNLGRLRVKQQDWLAARETLQQALRLSPENAEARTGLGISHFGMEQFEAALAQFEIAAKTAPADLRIHYYSGLAKIKLRRFESAKESFERALQIDPDHALAHFGLGYAFIKLRLIEEAERCLRTSLFLDPKNPLSTTELGMIEFLKGHYAEGRRLFHKALELDPHCAGAHFNLAVDLLLHGEFQKGWKEFLWIRQIGDLSPRHLCNVTWNGESAPDKVVLLRAEQGFGDIIQLARYAPLVKQRVGHVILECPPTLRRVLCGVPGVDEVLELGETPPPEILSIPLFNLPALFGTTVETIPWNGPYVSGNFPMRSLIKEFFPASKDFKVGIVWQGNPNHPDDLRRSMPAEKFARLAGIPGVKIYSLQKGFGSEQIADLQKKVPVVELGSMFEDFADTASVLNELDLVIGIDTSVVHLAGAMGKPAWTMISFVPEWRWMLERKDSPWYPSLRLFRQSKAGDWDGVMDAVAGELRKLAAQPR